MAKFSLIWLIMAMASIARIVCSVPLRSFVQEHSNGKKMAVNFETIYATTTSATNVATLKPTNASALMEFKDVRKGFDPNLFSSIYDNTTKHSIDELVPQPTHTLTNMPYEENKGTQHDNIVYRSVVFFAVMVMVNIIIVTILARIPHIGRIV